MAKATTGKVRSSKKKAPTSTTSEESPAKATAATEESGDETKSVGTEVAQGDSSGGRHVR